MEYACCDCALTFNCIEWKKKDIRLYNAESVAELESLK